MTEPYDSCPTCKTRHPKGWACPHELKVVRKSRDALKDDVADLQAEVERLKAMNDETQNNMEAVVDNVRDDLSDLQRRHDALREEAAVKSIVEQLELEEGKWARLFDGGTDDPKFYKLEDSNERTVYLKMGEMRGLRAATEGENDGD